MAAGSVSYPLAHSFFGASFITSPCGYLISMLVSSTEVLELQCAYESFGELVKTQMLEPHPKATEAELLGEVPSSVCLMSFPSDSDVLQSLGVSSSEETVA